MQFLDKACLCPEWNLKNAGTDRVSVPHYYSAFSYFYSAFSYFYSAFSYFYSAFSYFYSAFSYFSSTKSSSSKI